MTFEIVDYLFVKLNVQTMKVRGIIASPSITGNALLLLQEYGFRHVRVEPPRRHELDKKYQKELGTFT